MQKWTLHASSGTPLKTTPADPVRRRPSVAEAPLAPRFPFFPPQQPEPSPSPSFRQHPCPNPATFVRCDQSGGASSSSSSASLPGIHINIFVKSLSGRTLSICIPAAPTVGQLRAEVARRADIPCSLFYLVSSGQALHNDGCLLADVGVDHHASVWMCGRLHGGMLESAAPATPAQAAASPEAIASFSNSTLDESRTEVARLARAVDRLSQLVEGLAHNVDAQDEEALPQPVPMPTKADQEPIADILASELARYLVPQLRADLEARLGGVVADAVAPFLRGQQRKPRHISSNSAGSTMEVASHQGALDDFADRFDRDMVHHRRASGTSFGSDGGASDASGVSELFSVFGMELASRGPTRSETVRILANAKPPPPLSGDTE